MGDVKGSLINYPFLSDRINFNHLAKEAEAKVTHRYE